MDTPLSIPAAFAFHSEVTHGATAFLQEMIQITSMDLNNTERAIQANNLTQAIAFLHKAQLQLNQLNNNTLLQNVSTMLVQAGISSNLNPMTSQSSEIMPTFTLPPFSSSFQSVPDPQIPPQSLTVIENTDENIYGQNPIVPNLNSKVITPSSSNPQSQAPNLPDGLPPISSTPTTSNAPPSSISSEIEPLSPTTAPIKEPSLPGLPPISSSR
jgi:hypothetical protein